MDTTTGSPYSGCIGGTNNEKHEENRTEYSVMMAIGTDVTSHGYDYMVYREVTMGVDGCESRSPNFVNVAYNTVESMTDTAKDGDAAASMMSLGKSADAIESFTDIVHEMYPIGVTDCAKSHALEETGMSMYMSYILDGPSGVSDHT